MREWVKHAIGLLCTQIDKYGVEEVAKGVTTAEYLILQSIVTSWAREHGGI